MNWKYRLHIGLALSAFLVTGCSPEDAPAEEETQNVSSSVEKTKGYDMRGTVDSFTVRDGRTTLFIRVNEPLSQQDDAYVSLSEETELLDESGEPIGLQPFLESLDGGDRIKVRTTGEQMESLPVKVLAEAVRLLP
ncbi:hypothetical protein LCL89_09695 [Halobacillus yeomjeoni]|uniref:hypothetical protein n=1 Tax=Halobacillus yeomjeoni TaxID=311194 RepID=UPI001CD50792|nr:hypothetical protein [Halobacillus yeomjeoni]MCA0984318.1 hypothetical protein [Halobacillus yeomjeoni]